MIQIIPATKAKNRFGELIKNVYTQREHFIVEKGGIPVVAIIPISVYQRSLGRTLRRTARPNASSPNESKREEVNSHDDKLEQPQSK